MISEPSTISRPVSTSTRSPGGLGRGLAGILDDVRPSLASQRRGIQQLLGRGLERSLPRIRQFVTDTALAAIAEGFEAEAVVIARRDGIGLPAVVSSRIPPSWEDVPGLTFELFGQLWRLLDEVTPGAPTVAGGIGRRRRAPASGRQVVVGHRQVWLGRQETVEGFLVAAVVRDRAFRPEEDVVLARLVRSVAVAVGAEGPVLGDDAVESLHLIGTGTGFEADLCLVVNGSRRRALAGAATAELAVARAAAACWGASCQVTFAGRTGVEGVDVSVVVVDDGEGSPLLGIAVTGPGDDRGPVEAVVSAVSVAGTTPGRR